MGSDPRVSGVFLFKYFVSRGSKLNPGSNTVASLLTWKEGEHIFLERGDLRVFVKTFRYQFCQLLAVCISVRPYVRTIRITFWLSSI